MAKCDFSIQFPGLAEHLIEKAKTAISNAGGQFNGNIESGGFIIPTPLGNVSGAYAVENQNFHISIEDKPLFVSCDKIESELRKYVKAG